MPFRSVRAKEDSEIARDWRRLRRQDDSMCGILDWSLEQKMGGNGNTDAVQTQSMVQLRVLCQCPFPGFDNSAVITPEATSKVAGGGVLGSRLYFFVPFV